VSESSIGSCTIFQNITGSGSTFTTTPLDAGSISLTGPGGTYNLTSPQTGIYFANLPAGAIPSTGGSFTFTGKGGANVGAFTTTVNFGSILAWTNQAAAATINRSQGVNVTWTGGTPGTYVQIIGTSSAMVNGQTISGGFVCNAPVAAGSFQVPSYVLLGMPVGTGPLSVNNNTAFSSFTASGLDVGFATGYISYAVTSTWQ
jgi:hypothetical protein